MTSIVLLPVLIEGSSFAALLKVSSFIPPCSGFLGVILGCSKIEFKVVRRQLRGCAKQKGKKQSRLAATTQNEPAIASCQNQQGRRGVGGWDVELSSLSLSLSLFLSVLSISFFSLSISLSLSFLSLSLLSLSSLSL